MNQIASRFTAPRLDLINAANLGVTIPLLALQRLHDLPRWTYAKVVPSAATFKINPVSHALTDCAGDIDGIKANTGGIAYLWVAAEAIDDTALSPATNLDVFHDDAANTTLVKLYRAASATDRKPAWAEISHSGTPLLFTGAQTLSVTQNALDTNLRFHLLMGSL